MSEERVGGMEGASRRQNDAVVVSTAGPEGHSLINHVKRYSASVQLAAVEHQEHVIKQTTQSLVL